MRPRQGRRQQAAGREQDSQGHARQVKGWQMEKEVRARKQAEKSAKLIEKKIFIGWPELDQLNQKNLSVILCFNLLWRTVSYCYLNLQGARKRLKQSVEMICKHCRSFNKVKEASKKEEKVIKTMQPICFKWISYLLLFIFKRLWSLYECKIYKSNANQI